MVPLSFPLPCLDLNLKTPPLSKLPSIITPIPLRLQPRRLTNKRHGFLCEHSYGLSLLNVSWWAGEALHHTAIHQHSPSCSHLTSAAIMPHQVGQLPSLAAEQRAHAGSKIKCTAAGFHSQELLGLMLY